MVNGDAIAAMRSAHSRMYCIKLSSLKEADMANNQDSGLFAKTERAGPGECDAFLSHSWRDDAPLKWARMLEFKQEFEAAHGGTEPRCWLDKACIDQAGDIDASLKALPIFLLESQSFVVFAGATYTQRLWCVLEMFTFMRSGGALDRIVLKPLSSKTAEIVAKFDIASAQCFHRRDRHALLAVVESSYGSFGQFNAACRKILIAKLSAERGGPSSQSKTTQASTVLFSRDVRGADEITVEEPREALGARPAVETFRGGRWAEDVEVGPFPFGGVVRDFVGSEAEVASLEELRALAPRVAGDGRKRKSPRARLAGSHRRSRSIPVLPRSRGGTYGGRRLGVGRSLPCGDVSTGLT